MKKILLQGALLAILFHYTGKVYAQSACTQTLRTARSTYDEGRLHELPALLENCLRHGFSDQERAEAYKLLTLSYIYQEEPAKADETMLHLLRTDPYFQINKEVDPAEFIALYNTFRTNPVYRIGLNIGFNSTQPNVVSSIESTDGSSEYSSKISLQFGITGEIPVRDKYTISASLQLQQKSFTYTNRVHRGTDADGTELFNTATGLEKQSWISLPLAVQYRINDGKYNPYIVGGITSDYLLDAEMTIERTRDGAAAVPEKSIVMTPQREKINVSAVIGAGAKLRIFSGYFTAEARFQYGILKVNSETTAYQNQDLVFSTGYGDSVHRLNSLSFTIGYIQNIFKPKKN